MRKYLYIYKSTLIENLTYIYNILIGFIYFFIIMIVLMNLWQYIYEDPSNMINGYTLNQMMWYVLITEALWYATKNKVLINEVSQDIRTGDVAYKINKPYNYIFYIMAKYFGEITLKTIIFSIMAAIIGICWIGPIQDFNLAVVPLILIVIVFRNINKCHYENIN